VVSWHLAQVPGAREPWRLGLSSGAESLSEHGYEVGDSLITRLRTERFRDLAKDLRDFVPAPRPFCIALSPR
jgi:hypothetical protein